MNHFNVTWSGSGWNVYLAEHRRRMWAWRLALGVAEVLDRLPGRFGCWWLNDGPGQLVARWVFR